MVGRLLLLVILVIAESAVAGEIRGTIKLGGKPIGPGIGVEARCGDQIHSTSTDKYGTYRLYLPESGSCQLSVSFQNQTPSREIVSFEDSTRYDLTLEKQGDQYILGRR
jgi:hypothetical protein